MKLKLTEDGKAALINDNGLPIYVRDDGAEVPFDAPTTLTTISRLNGEAKAQREAKEAAEAKLKLFDGIEDPEAARKAIELTKNIDESKLLSAGRVEEIKSAARKAAEEQVAAANKIGTEALKAAETERDKLRGELYGEKIGGSFNRSKLIADKFAIPADMVQARFGQNFKVEDGKIIAYDATGNKVFSPSKPGEIAEFDEALEVLVNAYPYKDQILKGANNSGSGARSSNGAGGAGGKSMRASEFKALPLRQQAMLMSSKDAPQLVDDD
jgi:hypothetical protein